MPSVYRLAGTMTTCLPFSKVEMRLPYGFDLSSSVFCFIIKSIKLWETTIIVAAIREFGLNHGIIKKIALFGFLNL